MKTSLIFAATAAMLSVTASAGLTQEAHESPDATPGTSEQVQIEVDAGRVYDGHDLSGGSLPHNDKVLVTSFGSSGMIDGSSRGDY